MLYSSTQSLTRSFASANVLTGKTHLAISLGYLATQQRYRVRFFTAADLLLQLEVASNQNRLVQYLNKVIAGSRLLVIDKFGYVKLNETQANLFFQLLNITALQVWDMHNYEYLSMRKFYYRLKQKRKAGIIPV